MVFDKSGKDQYTHDQADGKRLKGLRNSRAAGTLVNLCGKKTHRQKRTR